MAPRSRHSCRGLGSSPSILSLEPACVSVTNGNFLWVCLCQVWPIPSPDRAEPRLGRLLLQQVKL